MVIYNGEDRGEKKARLPYRRYFPEPKPQRWTFLPDAFGIPETPIWQGREVKDGWTQFTHPKGDAYFYHKEWRLITPDDITKNYVCEDVEAAHEDFLTYLPERFMPLDLETRLFDVDPEDWRQDVVSHQEGLMYRGLSSDQPTKRRDLYWFHLEQHPMHLTYIPIWMEPAFLSAISYGATADLFGKKIPSFPFDDNQLQRITALYKILKASGPQCTPAILLLIARVMSEIGDWPPNPLARERNLRRAREARAASQISGNMIVNTLVVCACFGVSVKYEQRLVRPQEHVGLSIITAFQALMKQFIAEWNDTNLLATVFVTVNMGFIALPNVDGLQTAASLTSTLLALSSIVIGVHHVWYHRLKMNTEYSNMAVYLSEETGTVTGREKSTGVLLALPLALLMWSVIAFTVAVGAYCLERAVEGSGLPIVQKVLLSMLLGLLGVLFFAAVRFFRGIWGTDGDVLRHLFQGFAPYWAFRDRMFDWARSMG